MSPAKVSAILHRGDELMMYIDEYYEEMGRQLMTSMGIMQNSVRLRYVAITIVFLIVATPCAVSNDP